MIGISLREAGVFGEDEAKLLRDAYALAIARLPESRQSDDNVRRRLATALIDAYRREKSRPICTVGDVAAVGLTRYLAQDRGGEVVRFASTVALATT